MSVVASIGVGWADRKWTQIKDERLDEMKDAKARDGDGYKQ